MGGGPSGWNSTHTGENGSFKGSSLDSTSFAAHLTTCPTPSSCSLLARSQHGHAYAGPTERCIKDLCPQTYALNLQAQLSPGESSWQYPNLGGSRARVGRTLPGHLKLPPGILYAPPIAPFSAHLLWCWHPCLLRSPIPGLRHMSRRWNAPRTPMSLGSAFPPPGLDIPGPTVVGVWR